MEKKHLDIEEINEILPEDFKIAEKVERGIFRTVKGLVLPVINSKLYPDGSYWYSSTTKYFNSIGANTICCVAGNNGFFLIPIDLMLEYNKHSGWKGESKKGRQYHVRIKIEAADKMYFICHNTDIYFDLKSYYHHIAK